MTEWVSAGKVRMTPKGIHDPTNTYNVLDLVSNTEQNIYYIAKQDVPVNVQVTNTTYWGIVADMSDCLPDFLESIAPNYEDMTFPIEKGTLVVYAQKLYVANSDISTSEEWDSTHWNETTVADELESIVPVENGSAAGSVQTKSFIRNNNTIEQTASGIGSFAEGYGTVASGLASHAEGESTNAIGDDSHSEGLRTVTKGNYSHAEGNEVITIGNSSHIEGSSTNINCRITGAENATTYTVSNASSSISGVILGSPILVRSINKVAIISAVDKANNTITVSSTFGAALSSEKAIIFKAYASGAYSHVEGMSNIADDQASHAEGNGTMAIGTAAHSEGISTKSINSGTHSEGTSTIAKGYYSHAENYYTIAYGENSHVENQGETYNLTISGSAESTTYTYTNNNRDPAVGDAVRKNQYCSRVTAVDTVNKTFTVDTTLHYQFSNEGALLYCSGAFGKNSHAEGKGTTALGSEQHVQGRYNIADVDNTYAEIVGNGTAHNSRSNARTLDWSGNEALAGGITLGMGTTNEVTLSASDMKDMVADVGDLRTDLTINDRQDNEYKATGISSISATWVHGSVANRGIDTTVKYRVCTANILYAYEDMRLLAKTGFNFSLTYYDESGIRTGGTGDRIAESITKGTYYRVTVKRVTEDTSETADTVLFTNQIYRTTIYADILGSRNNSIIDSNTQISLTSGFLTSGGVIGEEAQSHTTDYINVVAGETITVLLAVDFSQSSISWQRRVCFYDSNKTFVSEPILTWGVADWGIRKFEVHELTVPDGCSYVRVSIADYYSPFSLIVSTEKNPFNAFTWSNIAKQSAKYASFPNGCIPILHAGGYSEQYADNTINNMMYNILNHPDDHRPKYVEVDIKCCSDDVWVVTHEQTFDYNGTTYTISETPSETAILAGLPLAEDFIRLAHQYNFGIMWDVGGSGFARLDLIALINLTKKYNMIPYTFIASGSRNDLVQIASICPQANIAFIKFAKLLATDNTIISAINKIMSGCVMVYLERGTAVLLTETDYINGYRQQGIAFGTHGFRNSDSSVLPDWAKICDFMCVPQANAYEYILAYDYN